MEPILTRLSRPDTLLRTTTDASFLVQGLLDLGKNAQVSIVVPYHDSYSSAVDRVIGVTEACEAKLKKFEKQILLKPKLSTVSDCESMIVLRFLLLFNALTC